MNPGNSAIRNAFLIALLWLQAFTLIFPSPLRAEESRIRVALYVDRGASDTAIRNFRRVFRRSDDNEIVCREVDGDDVRDGVLKNFDVLLVPGGSAKKEANSMGSESRDNVRRFVSEGGIYIGVCAGAYLSSRAKDLYLGLIPIRTLDQEHWYRVDDGTPVDVELTPAGQEVLGVTRGSVRIVYENGPIFGSPEERSNDSFTPLGFYRSEVVARGGERGVMLGAPAMILYRYGRGSVLAISPHPEKTRGMDFVILHAINWLYDHRIAEAPMTKVDDRKNR